MLGSSFAMENLYKEQLDKVLAHYTNHFSDCLQLQGILRRLGDMAERETKKWNSQPNRYRNISIQAVNRKLYPKRTISS